MVTKNYSERRRVMKKFCIFGVIVGAINAVVTLLLNRWIKTQIDEMVAEYDKIGATDYKDEVNRWMVSYRD